MKKIMLLLIALTIIPLALAGRQFPPEAYEGAKIPIEFTLEGTTIGEKVVLAEKIPSGSQIIDWKVEGGEKVKYIEHEGEHIFTFTATSDEPEITYLLQLPKGETAEFDAVYAMPPNNYGRITDNLRLQGLAAATPQEQQPTNSESQTTTDDEPNSWLTIILASIMTGLAAGSLYLYETRDEPIQGRALHEVEAVNAHQETRQQRYDEAEFASSWQRQEWERNQ